MVRHADRTPAPVRFDELIDVFIPIVVGEFLAGENVPDRLDENAISGLGRLAVRIA